MFHFHLFEISKTLERLKKVKKDRRLSEFLRSFLHLLSSSLRAYTNSLLPSPLSLLSPSFPPYVSIHSSFIRVFNGERTLSLFFSFSLFLFLSFSLHAARRSFIFSFISIFTRRDFEKKIRCIILDIGLIRGGDAVSRSLCTHMEQTVETSGATWRR